MSTRVSGPSKIPIFQIPTKGLSTFCISILKSKVSVILNLVEDMSPLERQFFVGTLGQVLGASQLLKLGSIQTKPKKAKKKKEISKVTPLTNTFPAFKAVTGKKEGPFWKPSNPPTSATKSSVVMTTATAMDLIPPSIPCSSKNAVVSTTNSLVPEKLGFSMSPNLTSSTSSLALAGAPSQHPGEGKIAAPGASPASLFQFTFPQASATTSFSFVSTAPSAVAVAANPTTTITHAAAQPMLMSPIPPSQSASLNPIAVAVAAQPYVASDPRSEVDGGACAGSSDEPSEDSSDAGTSDKSAVSGMQTSTCSEYEGGHCEDCSHGRIGTRWKNALLQNLGGASALAGGVTAGVSSGGHPGARTPVTGRVVTAGGNISKDGRKWGITYAVSQTKLRS